MRRELPSGIKYIIDRRLEWLDNNDIVPRRCLAKASPFQLQELGLRYKTLMFGSGLESQDIPKVRTHFNYSPGESHFRAPSKTDIIRDINRVFPSLESAFPLIGLILFGSRLSDQKSPRNLQVNPSDIDIVPILTRETGGVFPHSKRSLLSEVLTQSLIKINQVYGYIPIHCTKPETSSSLLFELNTRFLRTIKYHRETSCWSKDPTAACYVGSGFTIDKKVATVEKINCLIKESLSSEDYWHLRNRELIYMYSHLSY